MPTTFTYTGSLTGPKLGAGYTFNGGNRRAAINQLVGGAGSVVTTVSQDLGCGSAEFVVGLTICKDDRTSFGLEYQKETQGNADVWTLQLKHRF